MSVIVCFGDSNTHGTMPMHVAGQSQRHARGDRWPEVMAAALGPGVQVLSEGLPGRTTVHEDLIEGGARNGLAVLPALLHSHKPIDLMLLMLGTNDLKPRFSVTAYEISRAIERLVLCTQAEGVVERLIVINPPPVRVIGSLTQVFAGAEQRQQGLGHLIQKVALHHDCTFFDAADHVTVSPTDGVHWDAEQHHRLGAALAPVVARHLTRKT